MSAPWVNAQDRTCRRAPEAITRDYRLGSMIVGPEREIRTPTTKMATGSEPAAFASYAISGWVVPARGLEPPDLIA